MTVTLKDKQTQKTLKKFASGRVETESENSGISGERETFKCFNIR